MEVTIKKGLDLRLKGAIEEPHNPVEILARRTAIHPDDFEGFQPKALVRPGDKVAKGDPLMYHKSDPRVQVVSPATGTVVAVERGLRRHIERIVVEENNEDGKTATSFAAEIKEALTPEKLIELLARSGLLVYVRRRPFADIPKVDVRPRDIFVTGFDSAPLAVLHIWPDNDEALVKGAEVLAKITGNKVYFSHRGNIVLPQINNVEQVIVRGPHPSGLPGVQAANISPVNAGETVWTLSVETMWRIGRLFLKGEYDPTTWVSFCGSCVENPYVAETIVGVPVENLLKGHLKSAQPNVRIISGNVLTGYISSSEDYLRFPYTQLTVIPEGNDVDEFMGWASLSNKKMSVSPSFPANIRRRLFNPDARINGGRRAIIMSGEYDRVVPMDILTEYLIKAIKSNDIENMEKLGIYEVAPEDFALAEFVDSSKQPLQTIVRRGLDFLRSETE